MTVPNRFAFLAAALGLSTALSACGAERAKQNAAVGAADSTSSTRSTTEVASGEVAAQPAAGGPAATRGWNGKTPAYPGAPGPGNTPVPTPELLPGRKQMDKQSFAGTIRSGEKALATWPKGPTPLAGALLPFNRIVAYYGNPHSKKMGVIGEYPEQEMLSRLDKQVAEWKAADPSTPVIPAIHLVTVVASGLAGSDNMWRRRESPDMIEKTYGWAKSRNGLLFLDIQASHSTLQQELPLLLKYLERPDVMLGVDPEFYMHHDKEGVRPSSKVGQMTAADVNYVIQTLDKLVADKHLPPKILVVHRWTKQMVPDAESIHPTPRVQVVMNMDGWGPPWLKFDSYRDYEVIHPVQFTGFKIFYHHDLRKGDGLLTPKEVLQLRPKPIYIQYQ